MKKTEWPIRWDLLLRYRLIEIIALWEGRLTTNHICHGFGIGRQQASKDINTYLRELAPGNLEYDRHLKGYVPAENFQPVVTQGEAEEYFDLIRRNEVLSQTFETLDIGLPNSRILRLPRRLAEPTLARTVIAAIRQGRKLRAQYLSMDSADAEQCLLEPHTLICGLDRWYVRGWCHNSEQFRDFRLSRFRQPLTLLNERARHGHHLDEDWQQLVTLVFQPSQRFNHHQRDLIAHDYGMTDQRLELTTRAALAPHLLRQAGLGDATADTAELELISQTEAAAPQEATAQPRALAEA